MDIWFSSDIQFNSLYPPTIQRLARRHWTPLNVILQAVEFLVPEDGVRVLDIGSGVGKFCLGGAYHKPNAFFYCVQQREGPADHATAAQKVLGSSDGSFIHRNVTATELE